MSGVDKTDDEIILHEIQLDPLDHVELRASDDIVKADLEVVCDVCDEILCDAEVLDSIGLLTRVATAHFKEKHP